MGRKLRRMTIKTRPNCCDSGILLRRGVAIAILGVFSFAIGCSPRGDAADPPAVVPFAAEDIVEADIMSLQDAMSRGSLSAVQLTQHYIDRVEAINLSGPELHAVLEIHPDALAQAQALDDELAATGARSPLHGIPLLLKGNIDVAGLPNTAGSLALVGNFPSADAFVASRLRAAGAVILGTANLSEWANFRSTNSSSGWSSVGGQTRNPYVLDHNPCGSSSGSAVAVSASLAVAAVGTETDGSVVCPSGINGVVGIKPTLGLVSRSGIIPIAHSQDTAGPMGRTVRDAVTLLQAMVAFDPADGGSTERPEVDYLSSLGDGRLDGIRIGVRRAYFGSGALPEVEACFTEALAALEGLGAELVDPADARDTEGLGSAEDVVLDAEFKTDIAAYLEAHGSPNGMATLADLIAFNAANPDSVMPHFGQEVFERAQAAAPLDDPTYLDALRESKAIAQAAIDDALALNDLNALVAPTNSPAWRTDHENGDDFALSSSQLPAVSGYPAVTVPMCFVGEFPVGLSISGAAFSEETLLRIAYAFEQATGVRRAPRFLPTME